VNRNPRVGDLIIRKHKPDYSECESPIGLVTKLEHNKWGHTSVFIHWQDTAPRDYYPKHGYASVNIHNLRSYFDVIRNGVSIP
jgi:hypothetical protein